MPSTPTYNWPIPAATDFVKDGWEAISDLGNAIDTTVAGLPTSPETVLSDGTFTASAALNLSSVLSSTYSFYNFYLYATGSTTTVNVFFQFRENTTNKAASYFGGGNYGAFNGGTGNWFANNNGSSIGVTQVSSIHTSSVLMKIVRPSATTGLISYQTFNDVGDEGAHGSFNNTSMSDFNGISIAPQSGTFTGYYILTGIKA
jgi:hypothetical protein